MLKLTSSSQQNLTELILMNYPCDISLLEIARACPKQLTHLTIHLDFDNVLIDDQDNVIDREEQDENDDYKLPLLPHLLYLHLDTRFNFDARIKYLLRHCPELRVFQASKLYKLDGGLILENMMFMDTHLLILNDFDFTRIIQLCPKITSIDCDFNELCEWSSIPDNDNNTKYGLKTFRVAYDQGNSCVQNIIDLLEEAQDTLEVLNIRELPLEDEDPEYTPTGLLQLISENMWKNWPRLNQQKIQLPRLRELSATVFTDIFSRYLLEFLRQHYQHQRQSSNTFCLEEITLEMNPSLFTNQVVNTLTGMTQLKRLSLSFDRADDWLFPADLIEHPLTPVPTRFNQLITFPPLYQISLRYVLLTDETMVQLANPQSSVERIILYTPDNDLHNPCEVTPDGLIKFATLLQQRQSQKKLRELELSHFEALDDNVLEVLGRIESLIQLVLKYCPNITDSGLQRFAESLNNDNSQLNQFIHTGCQQITNVGENSIVRKMQQLRSSV
ncbi:hypothetical protein INT45_007727 [Circinella minor]|uniref:F-box domain-containing protein n=1 Tax=Circinella minor TaxID=1195481 RepID=A0A8H7VGS7_9FUNG|nr:hypothetical protein INT45_007727 [Circinella minor]